jgi:hypothetical protein
MGDRVLFQIVKGVGLLGKAMKKTEFGPVVYGHWSGEHAKEIVQRLRTQMADRSGDVQYSSARLVQCVINETQGSTGFGLWNANAVLTDEDSHGDAGVILIECDNDHRAIPLGGYWTTGTDGQLTKE